MIFYPLLSSWTAFFGEGFDLCSRKTLSPSNRWNLRRNQLWECFSFSRKAQLCLRCFSALPASLLFTTLCFSQSHRTAWSKLFTESMDSLAISSKCWAQALHPKKCWMYLLMTCSTIWGLSSRPTRQVTDTAPTAGKWSGGEGREKLLHFCSIESTPDFRDLKQITCNLKWLFVPIHRAHLVCTTVLKVTLNNTIK